MKKKESCLCPLCDQKYHKKNPRTRHHIFPRAFYESNITVDVCHNCHWGFNVLFPMNFKWSVLSCINKWKRYCVCYDKDMFVIYPILNQFKVIEDESVIRERNLGVKRKR